MLLVQLVGNDRWSTAALPLIDAELGSTTLSCVLNADVLSIAGCWLSAGGWAALAGVAGSNTVCLPAEHEQERSTLLGRRRRVDPS